MHLIPASHELALEFCSNFYSEVDKKASQNLCSVVVHYRVKKFLCFMLRNCSITYGPRREKT